MALDLHSFEAQAQMFDAADTDRSGYISFEACRRQMCDKYIAELDPKEAMENRAKAAFELGLVRVPDALEYLFVCLAPLLLLDGGV